MKRIRKKKAEMEELVTIAEVVEKRGRSKIGQQYMKMNCRDFG